MEARAPACHAIVEAGRERSKDWSWKYMYDLKEDCVKGSDMRAQTRMNSWPFRGRELHETGPVFLVGDGTRVSCESVACVRGVGNNG